MGGGWSEWKNLEGQRDNPHLCRADGSVGALVKPVHTRMPLIIEPENWKAYLEGSAEDARKLVRPSDMNAYVRFAVSPRVNSVKAEGPELIEPVSAPEEEMTLFG